MKVGAVLLAAGASTRLGFPKQLLTIAGETLLRRAARLLLKSECRPVVVVLGAQAERMSLELADLDVCAVRNCDWPQGMGSSIRIGVAEALRIEPQLDAMLLALCDQPKVSVPDLAALLKVFRGAGKLIAAAAYGDTVGVPAVFSRALFDELLELEGASGAKHVICTNLHNLAQVPLAAAAVDVDAEKDLESAGIDGRR